MHAAAGDAVEAVYFDNADGTAHLGRAPQLEGRYIALVDKVVPHRGIRGHDLVSPVLHGAELFRRRRSGIYLNGGVLLSLMHGDGWIGAGMHEGRGDHVLPGVLLHVVVSVLPVDFAPNILPRVEELIDRRRTGRCCYAMQYLAVLLVDVGDGKIGNGADIRGLAAAFGIECGGIQDELASFAVCGVGLRGVAVCAAAVRGAGVL